MRRWRFLIVILAVFGLVAAACGNDDDGGGAQNDTGGETDGDTGGETDGDTGGETDGDTGGETDGDTEGETDGDTGGETDGDTGGDDMMVGGLDVGAVCGAADAGPVDIVVLAEIAGESPQAISDFWWGAELAQQIINDTCGGEVVALERISTGFLVDESEPNLLEAQEKEPTAILGLVSSSQAALASVIDEGGIPHIYQVGTGSMLEGGENFTEWAWPARPINDTQGLVYGSYMVDQGFTKVALACVETQFGISGCDAATQVVEDAGGEVVLRRSHAFDETDFSGFIVDAQAAGAETVGMLTFPGPQLALTGQLEDNGALESIVPIGGASTELIYLNMSEAGLDNVVAQLDCNPREDDPDVNTMYNDAYGQDMTGLAATMFDSVFIVVDAVARQGGTSPDEVAAGISSTNWGGVCQDYFDSGNHALAHNTVMADFKGGVINTIGDVPLDETGTQLG